MNQIQLNDGQQAAHKAMIEFMESDRPFFTLDGAGGTGKTTVLTHFIRIEMGLCRLENREMPRVYLSAPTHKAVSVIADLLEDDSLQVDCGTLHSLLGLYLSNSNEWKNTVDGGTHRLSDYTLIVIDEGSMVGDDMDEILKRKLAMCPRPPKVIFLGDSLQLDPVRGGHSPVFRHVGATLTEQMRHNPGNPIEALIGRARDNVDSGRPMARAAMAINDEGDGVHIAKAAEFKEMVLGNFDTEDYQEDSHNCKLVAWRNREVDKWNKIIRTHLLGADANQIEVGEHLILQGPVWDLDENMIMHTEQEVVVTNLTTSFTEVDSIDHGSRRFKVWVVAAHTLDNIFGHFDVLHEDSWDDYNRYCKILAADSKRDNKWTNFWEFKDLFVEIRPPYACTVHKSQGSSFTNVFVVMSDLICNPKGKERNRLIYVGLSRARQNIILNTPRLSK